MIGVQIAGRASFLSENGRLPMVKHSKQGAVALRKWRLYNWHPGQEKRKDKHHVRLADKWQVPRLHG